MSPEQILGDEFESSGLSQRYCVLETASQVRRTLMNLSLLMQENMLLME